MKHRALTLIFATCFISSLALSESQTDAPLMPNDGTAPVVQKANCKSRRGHAGKKEKSASADSQNTDSSKDARAGEPQSVPAYAAPDSQPKGR
jgi:hypothetical protein